ncbi:hypothetical protein TWF506_011011 [Arthrobotrys conoides]|uniref:Uncharacterized protein n=1 Tax=Arthrobotrys conoides TaxID=74498 RepID=A0AAN8RK75_9PEZI
MRNNYTLIHKPQHRPNLPDHNQKYCTWCHPAKGVNPEKASTSWEQYETICSNPYALEILTQKKSLSRQAVINSMMLSSRNSLSTTTTTPKMIESNERVTVGKKTKNRKKGNAGRDYHEEMDLDQARLINWENEQNFERHDVVHEENWPTEDEVLHGEYLKTVFPEFRVMKERFRRGLVGEVVLGGGVSDQELRNMGLLYDSGSDEEEEEEDQYFPEMQDPSTPVSRTPYLTPMSFLSDSDLDELWEIVEDRRLPVEMRGEWDIISEF